MPEYISREAVLSAIWKTSAEHDLFFPAIILDAIKAISAADVRPVVRGKWIQRKNWTRCVCSACSWEITFVTGNSYNFCPNCGARMEES